MINVEIKARCLDLRRAERIARREVQAEPFGRLRQVDTYFRVLSGRLKLRHIRHYQTHPGSGVKESYEFISYHRRDEAGPRGSVYQILPVRDGPAALQFFGAALGVKARVQKIRKVYLQDNLRIHLDRVQGLGAFLELELAPRSRSDMENCRQRVEELLGLFGIPRKDLVPISYSDLVLRGRRS